MSKTPHSTHTDHGDQSCIACRREDMKELELREQGHTQEQTSKSLNTSRKPKRSPSP